MPEIQYFYYECENPECGLRFPGSDGSLKWNRCPLCRSHIHPVAKLNLEQKDDDRVRSLPGLQFEALLDNIRSAWNVGSIFRTADGTGIRKLYLCGITPSPESPRVAKTALGAELVIPYEKSKNGRKTARELKSRGYLLWALEDMPGALPIFDLDPYPLESKVVVIVGNEVCGIDPGILELCDKVISIPMVGIKHSYNVAVAFGIATSFLLYRHSVSQESFKKLPST
jgi:tRNA G18 (ribose-2'-O)-methylase SpoU